MWMVLRQVVVTLAGGLGAGALGVVSAGRLLKPLLFGIAPADPGAIAAASVLLVCVAAAAAGIPARAAARLDPAAALQE